MYQPKHRKTMPLLTNTARADWMDDFPSLAVDPPPVHPSGIVAGRHRSADPLFQPVVRAVDEVQRMAQRIVRASQSERGSSSLAPLIIAAWMGTFVLVGIGAFLRMIAGTS